MVLGDDTPRVGVSVAYSPGAGEVDEVRLSLAAGSTVADALQASGLLSRYPGEALAGAPLGVWGVRCEPGQVLRDRDRVEVYRPLQIDPKEARRKRHASQRVGRNNKLRR
jgi:uncharacterized protein